MTSIEFDRVVSCSSEDPKYPAENLLKFGNKWKCKSSGEVNATVILQFDKPHVIESIDIGNEHSAFIHVLVGRAAADNFESFLPASSFMSPLESDQGSNTNRVRMFTKQDFLQPAANEKWDRIKIICSQPFNDRVQYGLSFVVVKRPEDKPGPTSFGRFKLTNEDENGESSPVNFGRFHLKKDDSDSLTVGSLFAKRKELSEKGNTSATNGSSSKDSEDISLKPVLSSTQQQAVAKKVVSKRKDDVSKKQFLDVPVKNRVVSPPKQPGSPLAKTGTAIQHSVKPHVQATKPQVLTSTTKKPEKIAGKASPAPAAKTTPSDKTKRLSTGDKKLVMPAKKAKLTSTQTKSKPFPKLLEDVTIVISGYVNPARAILRSKALDMGAKYKQDWDSSCTHLICAFKNTPKFKQVQGHGHIVQKDWIEQCHSKRTRIPWRRFALDINDFKQPESEDEIAEEIPQPSTSSQSDPTVDLDLEIDSTAGCKAESGSDTEEEIERIENNKKGTNPYLSDTDIDDDDDDDDEERPDTSHLPMPPLPV